ncbi:hypothetical protein ACLKA7_005271 [Drosophila subpalustris]
MQNTHTIALMGEKMDAMLDIIRDMLSRLLPVTPQKAQQQHQHIEPIVRIATANPNDMSVDSIVFAESSSKSKLANDNGNECQARSAWTPLSHEKRAKDKSHARCHLIYMHLEHSEKYPVSLPSQTQQQKHIEQCRPTSQTNRDDNNIDRRQSHPNYKKLIQINPLIARQQQHQHQQQQQHTHMQIEMAQNQPKGNILAIAQNNTAEKLTSKHLQNQLAAKCCMQHGETQRQNMEQQHQQQQHQHQQQQCDPATPVCQYTGSGACSPLNCHMLTATPMWQQHWQSASGKQLWALLSQPRPQNAHSSGICVYHLPAINCSNKQQQLQQNCGSNSSSTSYRMLEQVAAPAVAADCGHHQHTQQQPQHPFRRRPQMLFSESNCHLGGNGEGVAADNQQLRGILHLMDMLSMRQLNGFCCPSWATGSHQHQHQHQLEQKQRQRQQHAAAASTTTANLANIRTITVATAAVPDAYGRICSTAGHSTLDAHLGHFHFTIMPPLPWPWQRQQQQQHNNTITITNTNWMKKKSNSSSSVEGYQLDGPQTNTPPTAQDTPSAAQDLPPAAYRLSPATDDLPPMDHVRPSEISLDSSDPEYEFNDVGDLVEI